MLFLDDNSEAAIRHFFINRLSILPRFVRRNLHLTLYHARRPLLNLADRDEPISIGAPAQDWRFMAVAPGGENPRPDIDTPCRPIAIRVRRSSEAGIRLLEQRAKFYPYETPDVIGARQPSNARRSAFGSRHYQPHVTVLAARSGLDPDLTQAGDLFRSVMPPIRFNRLAIRRRVYVEKLLVPGAPGPTRSESNK
jgi:hypothetical protein